MKIVILYGTESGNAELVAEEVMEALVELETADGRAIEAETLDMNDAGSDFYEDETFYLVICSTHGDGELPSGAEPFVEALDNDQPDLTAMRYAMFGLGDSSYDTYSRGSELIDERLAALGARRYGEYGRHDASSRDMPSDLAIAWAENLVQEVLVDAELAS